MLGAVGPTVTERGRSVTVYMFVAKNGAPVGNFRNRLADGKNCGGRSPAAPPAAR